MIRWTGKVLANNVRALHIYGGAAMCACGLSLWVPWAGIVFGGVFLIWLGLGWVKE